MTFDKLIGKFKDIDRKLFDKFAHLYYASLAYLGIKALDITSTALYLHEQKNLNAEANDLTRDLMEQFLTSMAPEHPKISVEGCAGKITG